MSEISFRLAPNGAHEVHRKEFLRFYRRHFLGIEQARNSFQWTCQQPNHEKDFILKRNIKASDFWVRDAQKLCSWRVSTQIQKHRKYRFVLHHRLDCSNIVDIGPPWVGSKNIRRIYVVDDIHYVHIEEAHAIDVLKRSRVAQKNLHISCVCCFTAHSCDRIVSNFAQIFSRSQKWPRDKVEIRSACAASLQFILPHLHLLAFSQNGHYAAHRPWLYTSHLLTTSFPGC